MRSVISYKVSVSYYDGVYNVVFRNKLASRPQPPKVVAPQPPPQL